MSRSLDTGCCLAILLLAGGVVLAPGAAHAQQRHSAQQQLNCPVSREKLLQALKESVKPTGGPSNGGLDNNEWAAVVNREGVVCAVGFSGSKPGDQWPGSRVIAIEKAGTANNFSLDNYAISTANLWAPTQPGESLYGLAASAPPVGPAILGGDPKKFGTASDPVIGKVAGGTVLFGGGLALYHENRVVGALGVSGDTSCADHNIAWRLRQKLGLDHVPNGPSPAHNDEIVYDVGSNGKSVSGWGHPECGHSAPQVAMQIGSGVATAAQPVSPPPQSGASSPPPGQGQKTLPKFEQK